MESDVREKLRRNPETVKRYANDIEEAIGFHKALMDNVADDVVWDKQIIHKEGGAIILEEMIELQPTLKSKQKWGENLSYWRVNYDSIRSDVYYRESNS